LKFTATIKEDKNCYASHTQREIILEFINHNILKDDFFLTGGTALSVFYLHHRRSKDLDFFTLTQIDLSEIDFNLKTIWKSSYTKIKESPNFLSALIQNVKTDFVIDPLSFEEEKEQYSFHANKFFLVDTIRNIFSNKFCAIVSRTEPKDFVDFYCINSKLKSDSLSLIYEDAQKKDAIFDDPPTVAYQIEQGIQFIQKNLDIFPELLIEFDFDNFSNFYHNIINWIYRKVENQND
jgi:predicted nucleotidyltransferase component of viral defense system